MVNSLTYWLVTISVTSNVSVTSNNLLSGMPWCYCAPSWTTVYDKKQNIKIRYQNYAFFIGNTVTVKCSTKTKTVNQNCEVAYTALKLVISGE